LSYLLNYRSYLLCSYYLISLLTKACRCPHSRQCRQRRHS